LKRRKVKLIKSPNIVSLTLKEPLEEKIEADIQLKLGDNITLMTFYLVVQKFYLYVLIFLRVQSMLLFH